MKIRSYCVYDAAAQVYLNPFFCPNDQVAKRAFHQAANERGHDFAKFAPDYTLFFVGTFDDETGELVGVPPVSLGNALQYKEAAE